MNKITVTRQYTEKEILQLAEFLVKYQVEHDGAAKLLPTAVLEAKERLLYEDFVVRPENSVDGKEHIFSFTSEK